MTKREQGLVRMYKYGATGLYKLYKKPSERKQRIYSAYMSNLTEKEQKTVRVWGNCQQFSIGWISDNSLIVESPSRRTEIKLWS